VDDKNARSRDRELAFRKGVVHNNNNNNNIIMRVYHNTIVAFALLTSISAVQFYYSVTQR